MQQKSNILLNNQVVSKALTYFSAIILLFACSQIYIPIEPVPVTLQTVGVMLIGFLYKQKDGIISYLLYLSFGALGIPVFAEYGSGIHILMGPTLGYFVGFLGAIYFINSFKLKFGSDTYFKIILNIIIATVIIFISGITWLTIISDFKTAIAVGLLPFILPGIIKATILSFLLKITRIVR